MGVTVKSLKMLAKPLDEWKRLGILKDDLVPLSELLKLEKELRETLVWLDNWKPRKDVNVATKDSWKHTILKLLGE